MRVEVRIADPGAVKRIANKRMSEIMRRRANDTGREMVKMANQEMSGAFDLGRPANRRRHPGSRRAATALDYQIDGRELPISVRFRVLGGNDVTRRIVIMNSGSRPHTISPNGNAGGNGIELAWDGDNGWVNIKGSVDHPGTAPLQFLERASQAAARRALIR